MRLPFRELTCTWLWTKLALLYSGGRHDPLFTDSAPRLDVETALTGR